MTSYRAMGETSFSMVYDTKTVLSVEIGVETIRVSAYTLEGNEVARVKELDLVEEKRM